MIGTSIDLLRFSSIPTIQNYDKSTLKAQSNFLKSNPKSVTHTTIPNYEQNIKPDPDKKYSDIIVISPGSRTLRFGLASDAQPREAAHAIARRIRRSSKLSSGEISKYHDYSSSNTEQSSVLHYPLGSDAQTDRCIFPKYNYSEDTTNIIDNFKNIINSRLKQEALEIIPDAQEQVNSYNSASHAEILPDFNDPSETDLITDPSMNFVVGNNAIKVKELYTKTYDEEDQEYTWKLLYPIRHGCLNTSSYCSMRSCIEDMVLIWKTLIEKELNIPVKELSSYLITLVIPDIFNKQQVCDTITALLSNLKFKAVTFIQESASATFAAAATSACIVNIGAQQTTVACVEDGACLPDSRFSLKYGGDDITRFLLEILKKSNFPYTDIDIDCNIFDWKVIEGIKERYCTLSEMDLAVETANFYVFSSSNPVKQYQMKYYYELALAPLLLFYPNIIDFTSKLRNLTLEENWLDYSIEDDTETSFLTKQQLSLILKHNRTNLPTPIENYSNNNIKLGNGRKRKQLQNTEDKDGEITVNNSERDYGTDNNSDSAATKSEDSSGLNNKESSSSKDNNNKKQRLKSEQTVSSSITKSTSKKFDLNTALDAYMRYRRGVDSLQKVSLPLDVAIVESVKNYMSYLSDTRVKDIESYVQKTLGSIILIGGGIAIKGLPRFLEQRVSALVNTTLLQNNTEFGKSDSTPNIKCRVLHDSKEINLCHYVWKGASVFSKLDSTAETWIGRQEWEAGGISKVLQKLVISWYS